MDEKELLWRQYELHIDLFKEYLNLALKVNGFYYVATGALVSFYFSKSQVPWMKYSLLFPALMSLGLSAIFFYGANKAGVSRDDVLKLAIKMGFAVAPEYGLLMVFLRLSAVLLIIVAVGLSVIIYLPVPK